MPHPVNKLSLARRRAAAHSPPTLSDFDTEDLELGLCIGETQPANLPEAPATSNAASNLQVPLDEDEDTVPYSTEAGPSTATPASPVFDGNPFSRPLEGRPQRRDRNAEYLADLERPQTPPPAYEEFEAVHPQAENEEAVVNESFSLNRQFHEWQSMTTGPEPLSDVDSGQATECQPLTDDALPDSTTVVISHSTPKEENSPSAHRRSTTHFITTLADDFVNARKLANLAKSRPLFTKRPFAAVGKEKLEKGAAQTHPMAITNGPLIEPPKIATDEESSIDKSSFFRNPNPNRKGKSVDAGKGKGLATKKSPILGLEVSEDTHQIQTSVPQTLPMQKPKAPKKMKSSKAVTPQEETAIYKAAYFRAKHLNARKEGKLLDASLKTEKLKHRALLQHIEKNI